jgi:pyruvate formate lyase activating enzyme
MRIAGLVKNSFVDYPGLIAAVVFVPGCNMDCWYCHNRALWKAENLMDTAEVMGFLEKRRGFLDGVVISGGEPTLQPDLPEFIRRVKAMGYRVKLDTNGLKPDVVKALLADIDYVAMDIKAPPGDISRVVSFDLSDAPIWQCADMLMDSGVDYEFRTTFMPTLDVADIEAMARRVRGARRYIIQQYRKTDSPTLSPEPHSRETIKKAAEAAGKYVREVVIRGI